VATSLEALARETPKQRWTRRLKKAALNLLFAAMAYALIVGAARLLHRRVLYQPPGDYQPPPGDVPEGATLLTATAADGVTVNALEFPAPKAARTIVHFHGNAETVEANAFLAREMKKRGFAMVLVEYRGYGRSRGSSPNEEGLYLDAAAVLDALAGRGVGPDRIVLWGQSLGTGVAAEMARRGRGSRLALVAPFTSTVDMASRVVPFLPASMVMIDRFDTLSKAPSIAAPTLVVHGDIDDVIPFEQGEKVSHALPHGTFLKVPEGRHDNLYKSMSVIAALAAHAGS
jgi:alpha-beta hydrolase superfamily lysophospholipase